MRQLRLLASQTAPGTKATLKLIREGKEKTLSVTLSTMPEEYASEGGRSQPAERAHSDMDSLDGVEVADLSDMDAQTRRQTGIPSNTRGRTCHHGSARLQLRRRGPESRRRHRLSLTAIPCTAPTKPSP